jgi:uncharacterized protein (TIGR00299 family) protein
LTTILFDIFTGISGDMTIGALLDAGADFEYLKDEINKLNLKGFELKLSRIKRSYIDAAKFDVIVTNPPHIHSHLKDIEKLIEDSKLSNFVKSTSIKIFDTIGTAEANIHQVPKENIHFHEVGATDSIIDIAGTCICLENLCIEHIYSTPIKLGKGLINTQHGIMPDPAPATLEILKDYPVQFTDINFEVTTPTGAAIIKTLSNGIYDDGSFGSVNIIKIGYGSGTFDIKESPNLLRVILCDALPAFLKGEGYENLVMIETNIDDMNPQIYPYVMEKLFEAGVNDVYYHHVTMKKGRPGILLSVLAQESLINKVLGIIYTETTTLGVRINKLARHKLKREIKEADTSFGKVKVKVVHIDKNIFPDLQDGQERYRSTPEFEECKRIAKAINKPVNEIYNQLIKELNGPTLTLTEGKGNEDTKYNYQTADLTLYPLLEKFALEHRAKPTKAEEILWDTLRGKKLEGYNFRQQHIVGQYIADFICLSKKLVIEIDGLMHQLPDNKANDRTRTEWFNENGFEVIRFQNDEIYKHLDKVTDKILSKLNSSPSGRKGGA